MANNSKEEVFLLDRQHLLELKIEVKERREVLEVVERKEEEIDSTEKKDKTEEAMEDPEEMTMIDTEIKPHYVDINLNWR